MWKSNGRRQSKRARNCRARKQEDDTQAATKERAISTPGSTCLLGDLPELIDALELLVLAVNDIAQDIRSLAAVQNPRPTHGGGPLLQNNKPRESSTLTPVLESPRRATRDSDETNDGSQVCDVAGNAARSRDARIEPNEDTNTAYATPRPRLSTNTPLRRH